MMAKASIAIPDANTAAAPLAGVPCRRLMSFLFARPRFLPTNKLDGLAMRAITRITTAENNTVITSTVPDWQSN
jgi:hypothetical protein